MSGIHLDDGFFGQPKVQEAYNIIIFFDGKQHPKNILDIKITPDFCSQKKEKDQNFGFHVTQKGLS